MSLESGLHARFAAEFGRVLAQVTDWQAPTPVPQWRAADLPEHLMGVVPPMLRDAFEVDLAVPEAGDVSQRWEQHTEAMQQLLDDPEVSTREAGEGPLRGSSLAEAVENLYTPDVFMHTWDLARAIGVDADLDEMFAQRILEDFRASEERMRASGHFGPPHHGPARDTVEELMAFAGRDPAWGRPDDEQPA